ncbi:MAG: UDP-N-acetylglucosamine 2-epimerase (non-hydrolyzing) [Bacteroidales bacterium]|nr:UDP-N-acetylglucosamine 2-epimerase (non-hydrolyzing) [Bacteroidales bacterium]
MKKLKVMTILGTRPEIIRLSRTIAALRQHTHHILVHTGQNYDPSLSKVFFHELGLDPPDHYLDAGGGSLGELLARTLTGTERVLHREKPDAVLILGDTNSSIAGILARRLRIPLYHMEAGNRCFDENVPEEINRRIIDHIADFNLVYTEHSRRNLLAEGFPSRRILLTGSPMFEVLEHYRSGIEASRALDRLGLEPGSYFLASIHREENVDHPAHLEELLQSLRQLSKHSGLPVVMGTHPRTRKRLQGLGVEEFKCLRFVPPFGFFDYVWLQMNAACVLSDSGTISEESAILGFPAISPRRAMERPEAMDAGTITLTGFESDTIIAAVQQAMEEKALGLPRQIPAEYSIPDTSRRVLRLILGTAKLSNTWKGIDMPGLEDKEEEA